MRARGIALLFGALALVSAVIFYSVLRMTGFLLKQDVARQQLLNYELSSRLLEEKFTRNQDDYSREIKNHVLETTILNFSEFGTTPGPWETLGSLTINTVRFISGKEPLRIAEDERALRLLQYAFFLERSKRIEEAAQILELLAPGLHDEDLAFALLHSGYCRFLLDDLDSAHASLIKVTAQFRGTHFARSAQTILDLMRLSPDAGRSQMEKGDALYQASRYMLALLAYKKAGPLNEEQSLRYARCLEETGKVNDSELMYRKLAAARKPEVRAQAVRRLLILGHFLGQGKETRQFAVSQAAAIKDPALGEIDQAEQLLAPQEFLKKEKKNVTVAEILQSASEELAPISATLAGKLRAPPERDPVVAVKEVEKPRQERAPAKPEPRPYLNLILTNGTSVQTFEIQIAGEKVNLVENGKPRSLPFRDVQEIRAGRGLLEVNGERAMESTAMQRDQTFFRLSGKRNTFIPVDSVKTVRAIQ